MTTAYLRRKGLRGSNGFVIVFDDCRDCMLALSTIQNKTELHPINLLSRFSRDVVDGRSILSCDAALLEA